MTNSCLSNFGHPRYEAGVNGWFLSSRRTRDENSLFMWVASLRSLWRLHMRILKYLVVVLLIGLASGKQTFAQTSIDRFSCEDHFSLCT